jgi:hypothetical protein
VNSREASLDSARDAVDRALISNQHDNPDTADGLMRAARTAAGPHQHRLVPCPTARPRRHRRPVRPHRLPRLPRPGQVHHLSARHPHPQPLSPGTPRDPGQCPGRTDHQVLEDQVRTSRRYRGHHQPGPRRHRPVQGPLPRPAQGPSSARTDGWKSEGKTETSGPGAGASAKGPNFASGELGEAEAHADLGSTSTEGSAIASFVACSPGTFRQVHRYAAPTGGGFASPWRGAAGSPARPESARPSVRRPLRRRGAV